MPNEHKRVKKIQGMKRKAKRKYEQEKRELMNRGREPLYVSPKA